jgi:FtsZ-binding cell division protein ZapB
MKNLSVIVLLLVSSGCFVPQPRTVARQGAGLTLNDADRMSREGKYQQAHVVYQRVAREAAGTPVGEEALYRSARVLLDARNPSKNYAAAVMELERYVLHYPSGRYADDAADLIAALDFSQQARVHALLEEVRALEKKLDVAANERREAAVDRDRMLRERSALLAERDALGTRLAALSSERDDLLKKRSELLQERNDLVKDNKALKTRVDALRKENERLRAEKGKLDKRLRDITAIDVKMEKERKKTK